MAMSYTTLTGDKDTVGSIKYFVRHSLVPSADILETAQAEIYSKLRVREMMKRLPGTILTGASTITLPSDCIAPMGLYLTGLNAVKVKLIDQDLFELTVAEDADLSVYEGTPCMATFDDTLLYLDAKADQAYTYRLWYMQTPANLAATTNETNFLTTRYKNILEAMCKAYGFAHMKDDAQAAKFKAEANEAITLANMTFDNWFQAMRLEAHWSSDR